MLRLIGGTHFLLLRSGNKPTDRYVFSYRRFDEALAKWEGVSRVSPIVATENASPPALAEGETRWFVFFGPVFPGALDLQTAPHVYLSLGILNVVAFCTSEEQRAEVRQVAETLSATWEEWRVVGNRIDDVERGGPAPNAPGPALPNLIEPFKTQGAVLIPTARECQTLLVATMARGAPTGPETHDLFLRFASVLVRLLAGADTNLVEKLQLLVNTNAALSRQLWQAYAGTPPIEQTPCHFATHSLLGIGTASVALQALTRFIEVTFERARIPDRITHLRTRPRCPHPLINLSGADPLWHFDHLFDGDPPYAPPADDSAANPPLPHVSCAFR